MRLKTHCAGCGGVIQRGTLALHVDVDNSACEPRKVAICAVCVVNEAESFGVEASDLFAVKQSDGWHLLPRSVAFTSEVTREGDL